MLAHTGRASALPWVRNPFSPLPILTSLPESLGYVALAITCDVEMKRTCICYASFYIYIFSVRWKTSQMATAHLNVRTLFQRNKLHLHPSTTRGRRDQLDLQRKSSRRLGFTLTCTRLKSKFHLIVLFFFLDVNGQYLVECGFFQSVDMSSRMQILMGHN